MLNCRIDSAKRALFQAQYESHVLTNYELSFIEKRIDRLSRALDCPALESYRVGYIERELYLWQLTLEASLKNQRLSRFTILQGSSCMSTPKRGELRLVTCA